MVYVYATQKEICNHVGKDLSVEEIEQTLKDMGMDTKGVSEDADPEIKIEITPERMDLVSALGIARAIKYYLGLEKEVPSYKCVKGDKKVTVKKSASLSRPKTVAAIIRNVPMTQEVLDEMIKIQEKVHEAHGRNRKKAAIGIYPVDNFEFPLTYSAEKPEDIVYRPLDDEKERDANGILTENPTGQKYAHLLKGYDYFPVYRDATGKILSMPPIINSHDTGKVDLDHKDLFIECSGYNMKLLDEVMKVLVTSFVDMGATAESIEVHYEETGEVYELDLRNYEDDISLKESSKLIGTGFTAEGATKYLNRMMYGVKEIDGDKIHLEIPPFRNDVWYDVDIADDMARGYGYNNIVPTFPSIHSVGKHLDFSMFKEKFSEMLVSMGFTELYTFMLTSKENQFRMFELSEKKFDFVSISNSGEDGINMCRVNIMPENLLALQHNKRRPYPQKVFENGLTIQHDETVETRARNDEHLCVSIAGTGYGFTDIKGVLDLLLDLHGIKIELEESSLPYFIEGRQAELVIKGEKVGAVGELHPKVLKNYGFSVPISSFEINLRRIWELLG